MHRRTAAAVVVGALALALTLTGCSNDSLAAQYAAGSNKNYIAGSGVTEVKAADRGAPINFTGETETGTPVSASEYRGQVLVVNFWYAQCGPCRIEAKDLQTLSQKYDGKGAVFLGVNTRDSAHDVLSFDKAFSVTYPSVLDAATGSVQLAFSGSMRPNATPTTLVLDKQGRVAARIEGPINDQPSTLDTLISDAVAESPAS
ncbi:TlpA family protein disulfide reductase [Rathayibacter soli]|uniref:TlpA family protein disulfide reductase n=1 Tax=Rathayibacter soli TaxID=3144168 RepID=UPI0027E58EA6|nr:TlpA disulfide reductase family protein [Glaciibacter superstes]